MKATLEFDLTDQDDRIEHLRCVKSTDMAIVLWQIKNNLKNRCEEIIESKKDIDQFQTLELVFEEIIDLYYRHNISVDELIN